MKVDWKSEIKQLLKSELIRRDITHEKLVDYLRRIGVDETKSSIDSKLSRGSFSATFLLQCLYAIGCDSLPVNLTSSVNFVNEPISEYKTLSKNTMINTKTQKRYIDIKNDKKNNKEKLKVISLFSGAGGLDIGLEQAGYETISCIENDIHCRETLRFNRPNWKLFEENQKLENGKLIPREPGDIREIGVEELLELSGVKRGETSLVVGGAPCQPFSNIGKKKGKEDEKNGDLFLEFVRIVKGVDPQAFIFENVAGITQSKHSSVIKYMIEQFSGSGYGLSYTTLNAADYGVAQKRIRFFLIGIKGVDVPAFPLPTHFKNEKAWNVFTNDIHPKPKYSPKKWRSVKDVFDSLPKNYQDRDDYTVMNCSPKVVHRMTYIEQGKNFKVLPMDLRPNCWKNGKHQGQDTFGRLVADMPSVTIRTSSYNPSKGMYIHPYENRGLNTIEIAAIQDFPVDWHFKCYNRDKVTLVSGGRQIGNAVPPGLARALGIAIKKQLLESLKESIQKHSVPATLS